jgi:hypothetical protein
VVNNAGISSPSPFTRYTEADYAAIRAVNISEFSTSRSSPSPGVIFSDKWRFLRRYVAGACRPRVRYTVGRDTENSSAKSLIE